MNQIIIGRFISQKRREKNLTQAQLGDKLGVSHKSVSKWETGKCMPDYSTIEPLCRELNISVSELLDGEENEKGNIRLYDDGQMLEMVARVQGLERQKNTLTGIMLIAIGIALMAFSRTIGGTRLTDFLSGVMMGLSVGAELTGVFIAARSLAK